MVMKTALGLVAVVRCADIVACIYTAVRFITCALVAAGCFNLPYLACTQLLVIMLMVGLFVYKTCVEKQAAANKETIKSKHHHLIGPILAF